MRHHAAFLTAALLLSAPVLAAGALPGAPDVSGLQWAPHPGALLPDIPVTESTGHTAPILTLAASRPTIIDLNYYKCPTLCGLARDSLLTALSASNLKPGRDYTLLALSIDPAETPTAAAEAKTADTAHYPTPGNDTGWIYATADTPAIRTVTAAIGFPFRWNDDLKQFIHPTGIAILAPDGHISSYVFGVGYDPASLTEAIAHARLGTVVPAPSPILLLCFHYDQITGKYSLAVMKVVRLAAIAIMLAIAALLWRLRTTRNRPAQ